MPPLSPEARARLKAAAEAKKAATAGRASLMGLDRTLGLVALDYAQERRDDVAAARWEGWGDGRVCYGTYGEPGACRLFDLAATWKPSNSRGAATKCPWVRLSYAPEWIKDELSKRFGRTTTTFRTRGLSQSAPVFPLGVVMEFLRFVWNRPDDDLEAKVQRYTHLYSDNYVWRHPGVGTLVEKADTGERGVVTQIAATTGAVGITGYGLVPVHFFPEPWRVVR